MQSPSLEVRLMFLMFKGCLFVRVNISFAAIVGSLSDVVSTHTNRRLM